MQPELAPDPGVAAVGRRAVIDTNVWLDLYVFAEPTAQALARALDEGHLRAVRDDLTDAELVAVIGRPQIVARRGTRAAPQLLERWRALAERSTAARPAPWRCRDGADQKFLDLAFGAGAGLLFTKDRALLDLAPLARRAGLDIMRPAQLANPFANPFAHHLGHTKER